MTILPTNEVYNKEILEETIPLDEKENTEDSTNDAAVDSNIIE